MTPAQLDAAIRAKQLSIVVRIDGVHHWTTVAEARENDGWLFVAGAPIPHRGEEPWPEGRVDAWLWVPGVGRISETVTLAAKRVGEGQSLLVAIGLRLHADNGTTDVKDSA